MAGLGLAVPNDMAVGTAAQPYMRLVSNAELEQRAQAEAEARQNNVVILNIAGYLDRLWEEAQRAKTGSGSQDIEEELLRSLRQRNGQYDPDKLAQIQQQGGSEIYMMLTAVKCRAAEAWIKDILIPPDEAAFQVSPTPIPELPEEIQAQIQQQIQAELMAEFQQLMMVQGVITQAQAAELQAMAQEKMAGLQDEMLKRMQTIAEEIAQKMQGKMEDQMAEGHWNEAFSEFITDLVTFPAAILKGPVLKSQQRLVWRNGQPVVTEGIYPCWQRVSPFDIYPSPDACDINDGYLFERMKLSVQDLHAMIGVEGYDESAIRAVIDEYGIKGLQVRLTGDQERATAENKPTLMQQSPGSIEALSFWGGVPGNLLLEWGMNPEQVPDKQAYYQINALKVGRWVVKAVINDHPLQHRPYSKCSFEKVPGAFWGKGVPQLMRDCQQVCNAAARALVNNMGIASGPQIVIRDAARIPPGEDITAMYPWKIWQFAADPINGSQYPPIDFFQPNALVDQLLTVFERFSRYADEYTNIPAYSYGGTDRQGGALSTASGLSMLMGQLTKTIKNVIASVDLYVIEDQVTGLYIHNMLYDPDQSIKGDCQIRAKGSASLMIKEQAQVRRNEFLQTTMNPVDMQIVGIPGRAAVLREVVKSLDMPVDKIVPSEEQLQQQMMQQQIADQAMLMQQGATGRTLGPDGAPVSGQDHRTF
jgi:hypothetical protein